MGTNRKYVAIILKPNAKPEKIYLNSKSVPLPMLRELCECDVITICDSYEYNKVFKTDYCIICDDECLLTDKPILNQVASIMYSYETYLAGSCVVLRNARGKEEPDCYGIPDIEADELLKNLELAYHFMGGK